MPEIASTSRVVTADPPTRPVNVRERPPDASPNAPPGASSDAANTRAEPAAKQGASGNAASLKPIGTRARLSYDFESEDVFIEILNPRTGDVIKRLPPEDATAEVNTLSGSLPGALYDATA